MNTLSCVNESLLFSGPSYIDLKQTILFIIFCLVLVWPGLAWSGLVWSLLPWHSLIWSGLIWFFFYLFLKQSLPVTGLPLVSCLTLPSAGISGTDHHIWFADIFLLNFFAVGGGIKTRARWKSYCFVSLDVRRTFFNGVIRPTSLFSYSMCQQFVNYVMWNTS